MATVRVMICNWFQMIYHTVWHNFMAKTKTPGRHSEKQRVEQISGTGRW